MSSSSTSNVIGASITHAYEVLGISHNASTKEIATAYKELARSHHPDKSSCPQTEEKFKQIKEAYDTLIPMRANMDAEEDPTASRNAVQCAAAAWLASRDIAAASCERDEMSDGRYEAAWAQRREPGMHMHWVHLRLRALQSAF